ncbi:MAG TPA: response regulator transcription factor, partial [Mycobacteriales bacterium]
MAEPQDEEAARPRLLLVEDDAGLAGLLLRLLSAEGYAVTCAADGQRALHVGLTQTFQVVVLDRTLPARDGLDVLRAWRTHGVLTPTLMLSARGTPDDRVVGLDAGAEDYLTKPFEVAELLARLRSLQRRHGETSKVLDLGPWFLDVAAHVARGDRVGNSPDREVMLSGRETRLLEVLARHPRRVFTREELLARVFAAADTPN